MQNKISLVLVAIIGLLGSIAGTSIASDEADQEKAAEAFAEIAKGKVITPFASSDTRLSPEERAGLEKAASAANAELGNPVFLGKTIGTALRRRDA